MNHIRFLLADSDREFVSNVTRYLKRRNIAPQPAFNKDICLNILDHHPADVIAISLELFNMTSIQALDVIRQRSRAEIILLTAQATIQDAVISIKAGAFDYLNKPVNPDQLVEKIFQAYDYKQKNEERIKEEEFSIKVAQRMATTERLASLGTLAAGVAHEINNPLAIINEASGWLKTLLDRAGLARNPVKQEFDDTLSTIENSVDRAKKITHQLISVIRKTDPKITQINLAELVGETLQLNRRTAEMMGIDIIKKMEDTSNMIWCDPYLLRQVLINLLNNAFDAIGSKGKITIVVKPIGDLITLEVHDTGEGIPKENLDRIFEPFFTTKSPGKGTGLGLYVTRGIIDQLGGILEVESDIGRGTRMKIKLPKYCKIKDKSIEDDSTKGMNTILK